MSKPGADRRPATASPVRLPMRYLILFCALCPLVGRAAWAGENPGGIVAGGLVFEKGRNVELLREEVLLSLERVSVRYTLRNRGQEAEKLLVTFPLPDLDGEEVFPGVDLPYPRQANFIGWSARADGNPVQPRFEEGAFLRGKDVTATVRENGLPLNPLLMADESISTDPDTQRRAAALPREKRRKLVEMDFIDESRGYWPNWTYKARYSWQQDFPPGREVVIEHGYGPITDNGTQNRATLRAARYRNRFCLDEATLRATDKLMPKNRNDAFVSDKILSHDIQAARPGAGPVPEFVVTVDKVKPDTVVSFCADGVRKIGLTSFQWSKRDDTPSGHLDVVFITREVRR